MRYFEKIEAAKVFVLFLFIALAAGAYGLGADNSPVTFASEQILSIPDSVQIDGAGSSHISVDAGAGDPAPTAGDAAILSNAEGSEPDRTARVVRARPDTGWRDVYLLSRFNSKYKS